MKIKKIILVFLFSGIVLTGSLSSLTVKIGSSAREGSPWDKSLVKLGKEWKKITGGMVTLEIHRGETAGSDYDMIRKMREGQLDGADFFNRGMPRLCPEAYLFIVPLLTVSEKEYDYIFNKMKPHIEKKIEENGFKVIAWSLSGRLRLFSQHPVFYPGDLQRHRLSLITWDRGIEQVWRDSGLHIVPTDFKDLEMALKSGMVNAFFLSPLVVDAGEYFIHAPNMSTQTVSPVYWGIVLTAKTWAKFPRRYKKQMEKIARKLSKELYEEVVRLEKKAVANMEARDLIINKLPADAMDKWLATVDRGLEALKRRDDFKNAYRRMMEYLKEYREAHKK